MRLLSIVASVVGIGLMAFIVGFFLLGIILMIKDDYEVSKKNNRSLPPEEFKKHFIVDEPATIKENKKPCIKGISH